MRAGTGLIHKGGSDCSIFVSDVHVSFNLCETRDSHLLTALNVNANAAALTDFEALLRPFGLLHEQILDLLVVNLEHRGGNLKALLFVGVFADTTEHLLASLGDDSLVRPVANHRVRFPRTSLAISKEAGVIAFPGVVQDITSKLKIYL